MNEALQPVNSGVLSVSALNRLVRDCLETNFPLGWVGGEISNLTYASSGHVYFSLKDAQAQVRCVMWRNRAQTLGWRLENGQRIEARVLVSFYEARGEFQLNVEAIRRAGQGDLFEKFLRLKTQLDAEGLFASQRKRPLPSFPRRLAIVTSPQAAALRDVLSTLRRRAAHVALQLFPTSVQGDGAAAQIAAALSEAGRSGADAIILCRGGGSLEDLWSFNEEVVARAIAASPIPVISGVGHETDFTIADFVADLRAPTPTAAAELAAPEQAVLRLGLDQLQRHLSRALARQLHNHAQALDRLAAQLTHPAERLRRQGEQLTSLGQRLGRGIAFQHARGQQRLDLLQHRLSAASPATEIRQQTLHGLAARLQRAIEWQAMQRKMKLEQLACGLSQLDPHAVLSRGYAMVTDHNGRTIRDTNGLIPGSTLHVELVRGRVETRVTQVVPAHEAV